MEKIIFENKCFVEYEVKENIIIHYIEKSFINYFLGLTKCLNKNYLNKSNVSLEWFIKKDEFEYLENDSFDIIRYIEVGKGITGPLNKISDVYGVSVGHYTIHENDFHTGITVITPHPGNLFKEKVVSSSYVYNGFTKGIGILQVEELGVIETDIILTSTLNSFKLADCLVKHYLDFNQDIGYTTSTINPLVLECNDGSLNDSRKRILGEDELNTAYINRTTNFSQGSVGAGSGMICHSLKGGIGSSSRLIEVDGKTYTLGVILSTNFGNIEKLIFLNTTFDKTSLDEEKGSISGVFATDLPLNERQLKRVLKRMQLGVAQSGSYAGNGSGDIFVGFSTENKVLHYETEGIKNIKSLSEKHISKVFELVVEATLESIYNSMLASSSLNGYTKKVKSLNDLIIKDFTKYKNLLKYKIIRKGKML